MLSSAKYKYVKIQRTIFLEDDLEMIFIDFGLLRSLYCKISHLLKSTEAIQIWKFVHMTQCAKIIVGFMANVGNVFLSNFYKRFFFIFSTFFYVFNVFFIFISTFITSLFITSFAPSDMELGHWVAGSMGHLGHLFSLGHRVPGSSL